MKKEAVLIFLIVICYIIVSFIIYRMSKDITIQHKIRIEKYYQSTPFIYRAIKKKIYETNI